MRGTEPVGGKLAFFVQPGHDVFFFGGGGVRSGGFFEVTKCRDDPKWS